MNWTILVILEKKHKWTSKVVASELESKSIHIFAKWN